MPQCFVLAAGFPESVYEVDGALRYSQNVSPRTPECQEDPDPVIEYDGLTLAFQGANRPGAAD